MQTIMGQNNLVKCPQSFASSPQREKKRKEEARLKAKEEARWEKEARLKAAEEARMEEAARFKAAEEARKEEEARLKAAEAARKEEEARLKAAEEARREEEARLKAAEKAKKEDQARLLKAGLVDLLNRMIEASPSPPLATSLQLSELLKAWQCDVVPMPDDGDCGFYAVGLVEGCFDAEEVADVWNRTPRWVETHQHKTQRGLHQRMIALKQLVSNQQDLTNLWLESSHLGVLNSRTSLQTVWTIVSDGFESSQCTIEFCGGELFPIDVSQLKGLADALERMGLKLGVLKHSRIGPHFDLVTPQRDNWRYKVIVDAYTRLRQDKDAQRPTQQRQPNDPGAGNNNARPATGPASVLAGIPDVPRWWHEACQRCPAVCDLGFVQAQLACQTNEGERGNANRIVNRMHLAETFRVLGVDVSWTELCEATKTQGNASRDGFPRSFVHAKLKETYPELTCFDKLAFSWRAWNLGLETLGDEPLNRDDRLQTFVKNHNKLTSAEKSKLVSEFGAKPMGRREWAPSALPPRDGDDEDFRAALQLSLQDQDREKQESEQLFQRDLEEAVRRNNVSQCIQELHRLSEIPLQVLTDFLDDSKVATQTLPDVALQVATVFRPELLKLDISRSGMDLQTALACVGWGDLLNADGGGKKLQHCEASDGVRSDAASFVKAQQESFTDFIAKFCLKVSHVSNLQVLQSELENMSVPAEGSKHTDCLPKQLTFLVNFPRAYLDEWLNWWVAVETRFKEWLENHAPTEVPGATFANSRNPVWIRPVPVAGTALREIFIDLSNLLHGFEKAFQSNTDRCVQGKRMIEFFNAVSVGVPETLFSGKAQHRFWAGSWKNGSTAWGKWANDCVSYLTTQTEWTGTPNGSGREVSVDHQIVAQVYARIRDVVAFDDGTTIVLVSGDGNSQPGISSIIEAVTCAVEKGCFLEVWGWEDSLSMRYQTLKQQRPHQVSIFYVDGYFLRRGYDKDRIVHGSPAMQDRLRRRKCRG